MQKHGLHKFKQPVTKSPLTSTVARKYCTYDHQPHGNVCARPQLGRGVVRPIASLSIVGTYVCADVN